MKPSLLHSGLSLLAAVAGVALFAGCQSTSSSSTAACGPADKTTPVAKAEAVAAAPAAPATPTVALPIRINAGASASYTDANGNVWLPDRGFTSGDTVDRGGDVAIANTKDPAIYRTERYSMSGFSQPLPNGRYTVKLHFAETFEGIAGPEDRVFHFKVEDREIKSFDVFARAGGAQRAYVETVQVEVKDGQLDITFTPDVENPEINGIKILPAS